MNTLLDRFCRYVRIDTQADETSTTYPSSPGQLELGRLLARGTAGAGPARRRAGRARHRPGHHPRHRDARGPDHRLDRPRRYVAGDERPQRQADRPRATTTAATSSCPAIRRKVIRVADNPELATLKGKTIITTDGTTLLGADDKAGVAVIMEAAAQLLAQPEIPHGPIRVCFTCDEEIGHGVDHVDLKKLGAVVGYTLDGGGAGEIDGETFSADLAS